MQIKLYPYLWIKGTGELSYSDKKLYEWRNIKREYLKDKFPYIIYDFFLVAIIEYIQKNEVMWDESIPVSADYKIATLEWFERYLEYDPKYLYYNFIFSKKYYPRIQLTSDKYLSEEHNRIPILDLPDQCIKCGKNDLIIKNGPYGVYLFCNLCKKSKNLSLFVV